MLVSYSESSSIVEHLIAENSKRFALRLLGSLFFRPQERTVVVMPRFTQMFVQKLLLVIAVAVVDTFLGGAVGVYIAKGGDALVGGATVLLGGIVGSVAGLISGGVLAKKLPPHAARKALWLFGLPALVLLVWGAWGLWRMDQETRDPEESYAGLPVFVVALERDPAHDPYLATRIEINAERREWLSKLPDGRTCRGRLRATVQRRVSERLPTTPTPDACRDVPPSGESDRVSWRIAGADQGAALVDGDCRRAMPQLSGLAQIITIASSLADSAVSCD